MLTGSLSDCHFAVRQSRTNDQLVSPSVSQSERALGRRGHQTVGGRGAEVGGGGQVRILGWGTDLHLI